MENLFNIVLTTSIYASVVGIVIILFKAILRNKINAFWHYAVWGVLLLKLLVPFGPESVVSLFNTVPIQVIHTKEANTAYQITQGNPITGITAQTKAADPVRTGAVPAVAGVSIENIIPYIWFWGAVLIFLGLISINLSFHVKLRKGTVSTDQRINSILEACKKKLNIRDNIRIIFQDMVGTPSLFGMMRPKILLTPSVSNLNDKELQYVLLHELAHYKRKDLVVNYLLLLLQIVHWFNPVMWYCFMRIRQDMELATDEKVLGILDNSENKEYGKALLAVLDSFNSPKLVPKLLGMVDDKKNMERRIKMIKMSEIFKSKRITVMIIGILCIVALGAVLLTNGKSVPATNKLVPTIKKNDLVYKNDKYSFSMTFPESWKGKYVIKDNGDTVSVHNKKLAESTPDGFFGTLFTIHIYSPKEKWKTEGMELADMTGMRKIAEDNKAIFAVRMPTDVQFDPQNGDEYRSMEKNVDSIIKTFTVKKNMSSNSKTIVDFLGYEGLEIDNIQKIQLDFFDNSSPRSLNITDKIMINDLLTELSGIKLLPYSQENSSMAPFHSLYISLYDGNKNSYLYIDYKTGRIAKYALFMSSLPKFEYRFEDIKRLDKIIDKYVSKWPGSPKTLEQAVSQAVLKQKSGYLDGEFGTEGHVILDNEEKNGEIKAYTVSSFGWFGFENGVFTNVSGSGAIPTVITFSKNQNGEYSLLEYKEPMDGAGYTESVKKMFPKRLWDKVLSGGKYNSELVKQKEAQAAQYLKSIGRNAKVSQKYVERKLPKINVEASNKLFSEFTKNNPELNKFPYWLGTREELENGIRYIYETSQGKSGDGCDLIVFKKTKQDGTVVKEYKYKIVGNQPRVLIPNG